MVAQRARFARLEGVLRMAMYSADLGEKPERLGELSAWRARDGPRGMETMKACDEDDVEQGTEGARQEAPFSGNHGRQLPLTIPAHDASSSLGHIAPREDINRRHSSALSARSCSKMVGKTPTNDARVDRWRALV